MDEHAFHAPSLGIVVALIVTVLAAYFLGHWTAMHTPDPITAPVPPWHLMPIALINVWLGHHAFKRGRRADQKDSNRSR